MPKFTLEWADLPNGPKDGTTLDPTPEQVDKLLDVLFEGTEGFAILSSGDQQYIQVSAGNSHNPGLLQTEYRAGNAEAHFELKEDIRGSQRLKQLFRSYMTDPKSIGQQGRWAPLKL